jgi:hypothetical protein
MKLSGNKARAVMGGVALMVVITASAVGPGQGASTAATSELGTGGRAGGNLLVTVPPAPAPHALHHLCTELLRRKLQHPAGSGSGGTNTIQALIDATGGTIPDALNWCHDYLELWSTHRPSHR